MKFIRTIFAAAMVISVLATSLHADFLKNSDLKDSFAGWDGDGERVFLKPDGTEGTDSDAGAIPVIKLKLSSGRSRSVYQSFETKDKETSLHSKVEVFASSDFKRSKYDTDYSIDWKAGGTWYWSAITIPKVDFWIRGGGSSWFYKLSNLKPGSWVTVKGSFEGLPADEDRYINFCVPPGTGFVYIKNPEVTP